MSDLILDNVTIEYDSGGYIVRPISALDVRIDDGKLVLLLGASGSGKTTLLSALAGLLSPTAGSIRYGDIDVLGLTGAALTEYRRHTVGIVFQAFNLVPSLTANENVQIPMRAAGARGRKARARATQLLESVDLGNRQSHKPSQLSGGQQQRVAIARALANDPPLVLADEPTAHLDHLQVEGVLRLLRRLARPGRTVVVATHDERLLQLADEVVELTPRRAGESGELVRLSLRPSEVLFNQGESGELVYVVDEGEVELVRLRVDGTEDVVSVVPAGRYFGELAPLFGLPRSATARASSDGPARVTGYPVRRFRETFGADVADLISSGERERASTWPDSDSTPPG